MQIETLKQPTDSQLDQLMAIWLAGNLADIRLSKPTTGASRYRPSEQPYQLHACLLPLRLTQSLAS